MNFSTVKSIAIPEGNVTALSIGGIKAWGGGSGGDEPAELLSWEGVAYHINKGTYKDVYAIGDMVPLDLGSEGLINMQIAAFDKDILADGSGTSAISWVAKEVLATMHRMNPPRAGSSGAYTEGTGCIGGWEKCEMRSYLNNSILPLIPSDVVSLIESVQKTQRAKNSANSYFNQTTVDSVWIPDTKEVTGTGIYTAMYSDDNSRKKTVSVNPNVWSAWWLRQSYGSGNFLYVSGDGKTGSSTSVACTQTQGVCLGFCTGKTPT